MANTAGSNAFLLTLCFGIVLLGADKSEEFANCRDGLGMSIIFGVDRGALFGLPMWIGVGTSLACVVFLVLESTLFPKVTSPIVDLILANLLSLLDRNHPSQHLHRR